MIVGAQAQGVTVRDGVRLAWARYGDWQHDRRVPEIAARLLGKKLFDARAGRRGFVLEGGGIDVNGRGTLLTTEECYLSRTRQVRNPGLGREGFEAPYLDVDPNGLVPLAAF